MQILDFVQKIRAFNQCKLVNYDFVNQPGKLDKHLDRGIGEVDFSHDDSYESCSAIKTVVPK